MPKPEIIPDPAMPGFFRFKLGDFVSANSWPTRQRAANCALSFIRTAHKAPGANSREKVIRAKINSKPLPAAFYALGYVTIPAIHFRALATPQNGRK